MGRDTVLRKTMLDECKGDRLEEVLAVFSNAVLKKVLQIQGASYEALAQQLALENFSYSGERTILSALIVAHKASLSKHLRGKEDTRARYHDFSDLLNLNDRRIARRHEQLKQAIKGNQTNGSMAKRDVYALQDTVEKNWSGNTEWLETILHGDSRTNTDGFLSTRFDKIWKHVENGSIGEVEGTNRVGLLEKLDARVKDQEKRLAGWKDFGKTLSQSAGPSLVKDAAKASTEPSKIDLGFNLHENIQIGRGNKEQVVQTNSVSLEEYTRLIENMRTELAGVSKPQVQATRAPRQSLLPEKRRSLMVESPVPSQDEAPESKDEDWSSASDLEDDTPESPNYVSKSTSRTPPSEAPVEPELIEAPIAIKASRPPVPKFTEPIKVNVTPKPASTPPARDSSPPQVPPITPPPPRLSPPIKEAPIAVPTTAAAPTSPDLAAQILTSISASSPSPKKPRHTLSLAERTRLSMSRSSHSKYSDLHDEFEIADLPRLAIKSRPSMAPRTPSIESNPHADLIERTRKSMAGFEAAQKKAQVERRRSVKDARKKQRESSYFPKVEEEKDAVGGQEVAASAVELLEGDPDYESVFKSRPKIATSPAGSPSRIWEEDEEGEE
ncbi:MAG: hypothetical protein CL912_29730 [Deltaproteobacteria bacterium]|nr:hypothetical protein [Deltaproteobacteria bacterium]